MRTKLLLVAAAALLSLNASAHDVGTELVSVVGAQLKRVPLAAPDFARVQGKYVLEDGRRLSVTGTRTGHERTLYADLGDGLVEMVHVGGNRFIGANRNLGISFEPDNDRPFDTVNVSSPAPAGG